LVFNLGAGFKSEVGLTLAARYQIEKSTIYEEKKPKINFGKFL
jgi:hypothetical protein